MKPKRNIGFICYPVHACTKNGAEKLPKVPNVDVTQEPKNEVLNRLLFFY